MLDETLPGFPQVSVRVRRSARARRLSLRVSQLDGRVTLTLPNGAPLQEGRAFLQEKADWIRTQVDRMSQICVAERGGRIPLEGRLLPICGGAGRKVRVEDGRIIVPDRFERAGPPLAGLFKALARERLSAASDAYAARLGCGYRRLTLRDTRSRWGSCTSEGNLMYSWRLIMAPPEVLNYVAAHEVAHLVEMNHSAAFWDLVALLEPDFAVPRNWLQRDGISLHRVQF